MAITASEARKHLLSLIEKVNDDRTPIEITSRRGGAVLLSRADYDALEETSHLLRVPANAQRLMDSLKQAQAGERRDQGLVRQGSPSAPTVDASNRLEPEPPRPAN